MKMVIPIRLNYSINKDDTKFIEEAEYLKNLNLIELKKKKFKFCSCGAKVDEETFSYEQLVFCSCGKRVREGNFKGEDYIISKIKTKNIIDKLVEKVKTLNYDYDETKRIFKRGGDEPVFIIIPEISTYNYILSETAGENCLFVLLDNDKTGGKLLEQWKERTFSLLDFLNLDKQELLNITNSLGKYKTTATDNKLQELLKKSPQFFEKNFIPYFLSELKKKDSELKSFLLNLKINQHSLINSKVIIIGGPSNPDFYIIDLYKYLSDGLKPNKYGEAKRYTKSKFTISDYGIAIAHSKDGENLLIVTTDDIQKEVWTNIIDSMRINNYFKNVIVDKDLLLMLINVLKISVESIN